MPDVVRFLNGFNIYQNLNIDSYRLIDIEAEEHTIKRYHQYGYTIILTFKYLGHQSDLSPQHLLSLVKQYVKKPRVINSAYGNPYHCDFGQPKIENITPITNTIKISTYGHSHRIPK